MSDPDFRAKYRSGPHPSLVFERGPWLKREIAASPATTTLKLQVVAVRDEGQNRSQIRVRVRNTGSHPAFLTKIDVQGTKRAFFGTDNWFWLSAGEERSLDFEVLWRDPATRHQALLTVSAWNAEGTNQPIEAVVKANP
jgi:beta-mannosidase